MTATDPLILLARQRIISVSAALEVELQGIGATPTIEILNRLKKRAAESLAALAIADLFSESGIIAARVLQNEVKRYDEWVTWMSEIASEGIAADNDMKHEDREELLDYLSQSREGQEEAVQLGLVSIDRNDA